MPIEGWPLFCKLRMQAYQHQKLGQNVQAPHRAESTPPRLHVRKECSAKCFERPRKTDSKFHTTHVSAPRVKDGSQEGPIEELDRVNGHREQVAVGSQPHRRCCVSPLA